MALSHDDIRDALKQLPGWVHEDDRLKKTFELGDFREAISFIVRLAFHAEAMNHHPELRNVYNEVHIELTTHDAGNKVTQNDLDLAREIQHFAWTS